MTQDKLIRTSSGAVTKTQAVRTTTGGKVLAATTNLRSVPFAGLALNSATDNTFIEIQTSGPVLPGVLSLGDGYACAVGTTVAGYPVRATDPTCASAPNWLGHCDAYGNITINPRRAQSFLVRDFGLVADGTTPNDYLMEVLRVALNNSPHNVVEFDEGIYRFNCTKGDGYAIGGVRENAFPFGTIFQGQGVSDAFRPDPGPGIFSYKTGTILEFWGAGVGLHLGYTEDANYGSSGAVRDLEIRGHLTTGAADYPNINEIGLEILTDTSTTVERVRVTGFKYGVSLDGAETTWLRDIFFDGGGGQFGYQDMITDLGDNSACGIRIGSWKCVVGGAANSISIENVQFNSTFYGIWHKDGINHYVANCNYELPGAWALIHGTNQVMYVNCESEGQNIAAIHGRREAGPSTCFGMTFMNCFPDGSVPFIKLENVGIGQLVLVGNCFANMNAVEIIDGGLYVSGPVLCTANQMPGFGPSAGGQYSSTWGGISGINGMAVNHLGAPAAALDISPVNYAVPLLRMRGGDYLFSDESHTAAVGGVHSKMYQVYNPNTGFVGGYKSEHLECINVLSGSATHNLGQAVSPGRGGGMVTIEVEGVREDNRTQKGSWTIRQHWKDDGGGPSLIGSSTSTLASVTDNTFVDPTIVISGGKFYAQITEHPTQTTDWSVVVTVRHAGA